MRASSLFGLTLLALLVAACGDDPVPTAPDLKAGTAAAAPLTALPTRLRFSLPPGTAASLTARVQYVGTITAVSSDAAGCASVTPASLPASKPAGSSVYVATFTVTPVGVGACTITLRDKKGKVVVVPVTIEGAVTGGRIVFASTRTGNLDLYMIGAAGLVQLTDDEAFDRHPVLSPDGSKVAFASNRGGSTTNIWVMNVDGTNPVQLTDLPGGGIEPAFSPDGSRIVFASFTEDVLAGQTSFAPDLWIMNADGTGQAQLTFFDPEGASSPRFSPDGTKIVFALSFQIWVMDADGMNAHRLTTNDDNNDAPSFSPDGTKIVYASNVGSSFYDIWVMTADGASPQRLTPNTGGQNPTFSPDGARIAFTSGRTGNGDIYVMDADGSHEVRLTADPASDLHPKFGP